MEGPRHPLSPPGERDAYRLIVDNVADYAIFMLTTTGHIATWNLGAERIKGYKAGEIIGKHFSVFYPREDVERGKPPWELEEATKAGRFEDEGWRVRKDGSRFWANVVITALRDEGGVLRGFGKVTRDLSGRRQAEQRLAEKTAQLEETVADLERFTYTVAHDLRAPLRTVHRFADLVLAGLDSLPAETIRDYLSRVTAGAGRMDHLINDLLSYSRVGRGELTTEAVDLGAVVREIVAGLTVQIQDSGGVVRLPEAFPPIKADRFLLGQVLANLLANALKFVPRGRRPEVSIRAEGTDGGVRVSVRDNGIGIDPQFRERLFKLFERLHSREEYPGTGIGLAIVGKAVERMGGRCGVDSAPGEGSTFWFELPAV